MKNDFCIHLWPCIRLHDQIRSEPNNALFDLLSDWGRILRCNNVRREQFVSGGNTNSHRDLFHLSRDFVMYGVSSSCAPPPVSPLFSPYALRGLKCRLDPGWKRVQLYKPEDIHWDSALSVRGTLAVLGNATLRDDNFLVDLFRPGSEERTNLPSREWLKIDIDLCRNPWSLFSHLACWIRRFVWSNQGFVAHDLVQE
jgi:hypothetical protein